MQCAQPETRKRAVEAPQRAMMEAQEYPSRYGLRGVERQRYQAEQAKRIQTVKYCG